MTENFYFRNHLCIAMELLSINLYELIKANGFVGFTTTLIRRFTTQMLGSLSLMRHHRIVHCDLKPEVWRLWAYKIIYSSFLRISCYGIRRRAASRSLTLAAAVWSTKKVCGFHSLARSLAHDRSIYVYPKPLLPLARSHPWHEL